MTPPTRRALLGALFAPPFAVPLLGFAPADDRPGARLAPWTPGYLDIHHIATGRGDCSLIIAPDGTSLMIDAGATAASPPFALEARPGPDRRPGEWIARYAARRLRDTGGPGLDYLLVTHIHPDHVGDVLVGSPPSPSGGYHLTGVSDVAQALPIGLVLDRGFPDYSYPAVQTQPWALNYIAFIRARTAAGGRVERLRAGTSDQIRPLRAAGPASRFAVRTLAVDGVVATGAADGASALFPSASQLPAADLPDENMCSAAIALEYGDFGYFAAGDLTSNTFDGAEPWRDALTPAARAAGPMDVAVVPHHGLYDGLSADAARALRPRVWICDDWHVSHPSLSTLERLFSERLYAGTRDVFATGLSPANALVADRLARRLASADGHVVVRVAPGGASYRVVVTDNHDEEDRVLRVTAPLASRRGAAASLRIR
jgi:glyoxylase-like metal-dependent hydrolase (beta-lactamase superfamily II)